MKREIGVGLGLSAALVLGADCSAEQQPVEQTAAYEVSAAQRATVERAFTTARDFWVARGVGGVATTKLVILNGEETFACNRMYKTGALAANDASQYCPGNNAVVITAASVLGEAQTLRKTHLPNDGVADVFEVNHELGHAVQNAQGKLRPIYTKAGIENPAIITPIELGATCYAGMQMAHTYPHAMINEVQEIVQAESGGADQNHGSQADQANSFMRGALQGNC